MIWSHLPREGAVNLAPEVDKYQVVVARSGYLDRMTFHIALVNESIDKALLKGRLERDIQDTLNLKGEIEFVGRGVIFDKHHKIKDERKWEFFKGPPGAVISVIGPYVREKPKISASCFPPWHRWASIPSPSAPPSPAAPVSWMQGIRKPPWMP